MRGGGPRMCSPGAALPTMSGSARTSPSIPYGTFDMRDCLLLDSACCIVLSAFRSAAARAHSRPQGTIARSGLQSGALGKSISLLRGRRRLSVVGIRCGPMRCPPPSLTVGRSVRPWVKGCDRAASPPRAEAPWARDAPRQAKAPSTSKEAEPVEGGAHASLREGGASGFAGHF
jgi:hypothetical protein